MKKALKSLKPLNPTIKLGDYKNKIETFNKLLSLGYDFSLLKPKRRIQRSQGGSTTAPSDAESYYSFNSSPNTSIASSVAPSVVSSVAPSVVSDTESYRSAISRAPKNPYAIKIAKKKIKIAKKPTFLENMKQVVKNINNLPSVPNPTYKKNKPSKSSNIGIDNKSNKTDKLKIIKEPKIKPKKVNKIIYVSPENAAKSAALFDKPTNIPLSSIDILKPIANINALAANMSKNKVKRKRDFSTPTIPEKPIITAQEKKRMKNKIKREVKTAKNVLYVQKYNDMLRPNA